MDDENNSDCKYSHAPVDIFVDLSKRTTDVLKLIGVGDDAEAANDLIETKIMRSVFLSAVHSATLFRDFTIRHQYQFSLSSLLFLSQYIFQPLPIIS